MAMLITIRGTWPYWRQSVDCFRRQANSAFHPFGVDKRVVSCNQMSAASVGVTLSGEWLWSEGLVWLVGAVVW